MKTWKHLKKTWNNFLVQSWNEESLSKEDTKPRNINDWKMCLHKSEKNNSSWPKILQRKTKDKLQMGTNINKTDG